jgi:cell division cycle 20-like protein 1 (cofactor of APC complex)
VCSRGSVVRTVAEAVSVARFIPSRDSVGLSTSYNLLPEGGRYPSTPTRGGKRKIERGPESDAQRGTFNRSNELAPRLNPRAEEANKTFNALLKTELFGPSNASNSNIDSALDTSFLTNSPSSGSRYAAGTTAITTAPAPTSPTRNLFSFRSPARKRVATGLDSPTHERYSVSPVRYESQKLLLSPRKTPRSLSKVPFKVLDAPELAVSSQEYRALAGADHVAGRLLSQPSRLVVDQRARRWPRFLRLPLVGSVESGYQALRPERE